MEMRLQDDFIQILRNEIDKRNLTRLSTEKIML
ncbi:sporulation histidine kinase inhibitor Sda [Salicibibacter cibarius]|uniref:Sporulation histidine kinase inhibitor Sda n=1 Tax=Salicibibacter cibarius TaxID=2743000 RepID=A0A7T7CDW2_9BACI|nr:sporulation histidine kinase inhibitor Sda [Salicibibacter cibarius]